MHRDTIQSGNFLHTFFSVPQATVEIPAEITSGDTEHVIQYRQVTYLCFGSSSRFHKPNCRSLVFLLSFQGEVQRVYYPPEVPT